MRRIFLSRDPLTTRENILSFWRRPPMRFDRLTCPPPRFAPCAVNFYPQVKPSLTTGLFYIHHTGPQRLSPSSMRLPFLSGTQNAYNTNSTA